MPLRRQFGGGGWGGGIRCGQAVQVQIDRGAGDGGGDGLRLDVVGRKVSGGGCIQPEVDVQQRRGQGVQSGGGRAAQLGGQFGRCQLQRSGGLQRLHHRRGAGFGRDLQVECVQSRSRGGHFGGVQHQLRGEFAGQVDAHQLTGQTQGLGRCDHRLGRKGLVVGGGDGGHPGLEVPQCVAGEGAQVGAGWRLFGQPVVVQLFAGPGGFTESAETHHPGTALEGVEGAAHAGDLGQVRGGLRQRSQRLAGLLQHLGGFVQEHLAHLVVALQAGGLEGRRGRLEVQRDRPRHQARAQRFEAHRVAGGGHEVVQRLHHMGAQAAVHVGGFVAGAGRRGADGGLRSRQGGRQHRLAADLALAGQGVDFDRGRLQRQLVAAHRVGDGMGAFDQVRRHRTAAHHRGQVAAVRIEAEQRAGHLRLHAEHVDQETQRPQVAGQPLDGCGHRRLVGVGFAVQQGLDVLAHAHAGLHRRVHPQHGEHAAHGAQLSGHPGQQSVFARMAEELIGLALHLGQRAAQLLHHRPHGLPVGHAPVELLHPGLQRLWRIPADGLFDAFGQATGAAGLAGRIELRLLQRGIQVQQAGGHLHGQGRCRGAGLAGRQHRGVEQGTGQGLAGRVEPPHRVAHQGEGLDQLVQPVQLLAGHAVPGFLGGCHPLARLLEVGRIEASVERLQVVHPQQGRIQRVGLSQGGEPGGGRADVTRAGTEEQQVLREPVRHLRITLDAVAQLRHHPRGGALDEDIRSDGPQRPGFEEGGGDAPEGHR